MSSRPVTMAMIAKALGVSKATVSLALAGHPRISTVTRERVLEAAKVLGYQRDPFLQALAQYGGQSPARRKSTEAIAVVHEHGTKFWYEISPVFEMMDVGMQQSCERLGLRVESWSIGVSPKEQQEVGEVLYHRGYRGLILAPLPHGAVSHVPRIPLERFSVVAMGLSLTSPAFHCAYSDPYQNARLLTAEAFAQGYQRPGLVLTRAFDERTQGEWYAGFAYECRKRGKDAGKRIWLPEEIDAIGLERWLERSEVDIVLTQAYHREAWQELWDSFGAGRPCWYLDVTGRVGEAGIEPQAIRVGEAAIELVHMLMRQGRRGVPEDPLRLGIPGVFQHGS